MKLKNKGLYAFLLIPFFRPLGLEVSRFHFLYYFFTTWEAIAIAFFIMMLYKSKKVLALKRHDESKFIKIYIIYTFAISFVFKFLNGNDLIPLVGLLSFCLSPLIVIYIAEKDYKFIVDFFYRYLLIINLLNFLFIVIPPLGSLITVKEYFFIGHRQAVPMVWALSVMLCSIKFNEQKGKAKGKRLLGLLLYVAIASYNILNAAVSTGIVVFGLFALMYIIMVVFNKIERINDASMYILFIAGLVVNYLIIAFNIQDYFSYYLARYLGETTSLNGRIVIFNVFRRAVSGAPIFGYGYKGLEVSTGWGGAWDALDYAHNTLLQELTNGGAIGLILFITMSLFAIHGSLRSKNLNHKKIVLCTLVAELVIMCTESINYYGYYMVFLVIITYLHELDDIREISKLKSTEV